MRTFTRIILFVGLLMMSSFPLLAQSAAEPSGHWVGSVRTPRMEVAVEFDLQKGANSMFHGTFGQPENGVKGLPLSAVAVDGSSIIMIVKADTDPATFSGELSEDGESISGSLAQSDYEFPFSLKRTGEARIAAAPKSRAIGKEMEGTWNGTLDAGDRKMRLILKMSNQPDGTATGTVVSPDGSGVPIAIGMTQNGANLTIEVPSVGASFSGILNSEGTSLTGTWTQSGAAVQLTLQRANQ